MKNKIKNFCVVITWDNTDPTVYGPFDNEKNATAKLDEVTASWGDWEWGCQTGHAIKELKN